MGLFGTSEKWVPGVELGWSNKRFVEWKKRCKMLIRSSQFDPRNPLKTTLKKRLFLTFLQKTLFSKFWNFKNSKISKELKNWFQNLRGILKFPRFWNLFGSIWRCSEGRLGVILADFCYSERDEKNGTKIIPNKFLRYQKFCCVFLHFFLVVFDAKKGTF